MGSERRKESVRQCLRIDSERGRFHDRSFLFLIFFLFCVSYLLTVDVRYSASSSRNRVQSTESISVISYFRLLSTDYYFFVSSKKKEKKEKSQRRENYQKTKVLLPYPPSQERLSNTLLSRIQMRVSYL